MNNRLYIALIVFLLVALACTHIYRTVDARLYPAPEISKKAQIGVLEDIKNPLLVFLGQVEKADIVLLYYYCRFPDGWRVDPRIYDVYPLDGKVVHHRKANCPSGLLRVEMKAFNNFRKRTEKSAVQRWNFTLESLTKETAQRI